MCFSCCTRDYSYTTQYLLPATLSTLGIVYSCLGRVPCESITRKIMATRGRLLSAHQWDAEVKLVHEENKWSNESRWWKPLSKKVMSRSRLTVRADGQGQGSNTVTYFGLQLDRSSWELIEHNMWFYYYCLTGMLGSVYGYILAVNLCLLIPYELISRLLVIVSSAVFGIAFFGLLILCVAVEWHANSIIPPRQLNSDEQFYLTLTVCVLNTLFIVGILILAQFEALTSRPLVMVGITLTGIDLMIFSLFFVYSYYLPENKLLVVRS